MIIYIYSPFSKRGLKSKIIIQLKIFVMNDGIDIFIIIKNLHDVSAIIEQTINIRFLVFS